MDKKKLGCWIVSIVLGIAFLLGIIVGHIERDALIGFYVMLAISMFCVMPFVKNIVLYIGRNVIDFATTIDLIFVMTIIFAGIYKNTHLGWFIVAAFLYLIYAVLKNYVLYLFIDMRDSLKKFSENTVTASEKTTNCESSDVSDKLAEDEQHCPFCNKVIKKVAKKCRFCGKWLETNEGEQQ